MGWKGLASKGRKAGTIILLQEKLTYNLVSVNKDEDGRLVSIHLKFQSREEKITNIYVPNSPPKSYFTDLTSQLAKKTSLPQLIGGDFNSVLHNSEDRSSPHYRPRPTTRDQFANFYHMVNALQHPDRYMETTAFPR